MHNLILKYKGEKGLKTPSRDTILGKTADSELLLVILP